MRVETSIPLDNWRKVADRARGPEEAGFDGVLSAEISDDVVHTFTAVARHDQLREAVENRFGGLVDSITLDFGGSMDLSERVELIQDLQEIPKEFQDFPAT